MNEFGDRTELDRDAFRVHLNGRSVRMPRRQVISALAIAGVLTALQIGAWRGASR